MTKAIVHPLLVLTIISLLSCTSSEITTKQYDLVVLGGRVIDSASGLDAVRNIGIQDEQIVVITEDSIDGNRIVDATGLIVSAGFIDLHAHGQSEESFSIMVQDGVTTAFELEVGTDDVSKWYGDRAGGQILNYGVSIGHIRTRMNVMGDSGKFLPNDFGGSALATEKQIAMMEKLIRNGLRQGAVAVGFGLAYTPATTNVEFDSMLRIVAEHGTTAHIHVRGSLEGGLEGLIEAIESAKKSGASLHVVHANSSGGASTADFLRIIEEARSNGQDVTTEAYPYEAGMTSIESALFDDWESWNDDRFPVHQWVETGERLTRESFARYRKQGGFVIIHNRTVNMTRAAIENPLTMIASDGKISEGRGHPRTSGTYAKVLGKYVREESVLTLTDALRRMTIEPARRLEGYVSAMRKKGRLSVGADADITIFDAEKVIDRSTYVNPQLPSDGIEYVIVNGVLVVDKGKFVPDTRAGRAIRAL